MAAALVANGEIATVKSSVYSEVQNSRLDHPLPLPSVLRSAFKVVDGPRSSAAGNPGMYLPICIHIYPHSQCLSTLLRDVMYVTYK